jgi:hypothetical protein
MFIERMKLREYKQIHAETFFWRTYDQKEIDLVEERDGNLFGYEFKHRQNKSTPAPTDWQKAYPDAEFKVISRDNIEEFVLN